VLEDEDEDEDEGDEGAEREGDVDEASEAEGEAGGETVNTKIELEGALEDEDEDEGDRGAEVEEETETDDEAGGDVMDDELAATDFVGEEVEDAAGEREGTVDVDGEGDPPETPLIVIPLKA